MSKKKSTGQIHFGFADVQSKFKKRRELKHIVHQIFEDNGQPLQSLQYVFCSDNYLLDLNHRFLQHDTYTDIITFTLSNADEPIEGEIYISLDRIKDNASSLGTTPDSELARVIFHGALHLCGYKDKTSSQKKIMRTQENNYLGQLT